MSGTLTLAATPIGNFRDASPRLIEALQTFPFIAAEDTRTLVELLRRLQIEASGTLVSYHEHNEKARVVKIIELLQHDHDVLVVSDAGMPTVSDPGFPLVQAAIEANIPVTVIPGPSAVLTALALSGLPSDSFSFEGFVPRKENQRHSFFTKLAHEQRTMIFFEAPHRIEKTIAMMVKVFGEDRQLVLARELTKKFEEVRRGTCAEIFASLLKKSVKGEIVLVLAGFNGEEISFENALEQVQTLVHDGLRLKDACKQVSSQTGISSKELYNTTVIKR
ncbi:MAG: 16S rRNA (cytidine(1402)-2'-O)-methyltransferase [Micrococcaceae bacterium]